MFTTDRRWGHDDLKKAEEARAKDIAALTDEHIAIFGYFYSEKTAIELRKQRYKAIHDPALTPEQEAAREIAAKRAPAITVPRASAIPKHIAERDRGKDGPITKAFLKLCKSPEEGERLLATPAMTFSLLEAMDDVREFATNQKEVIGRLEARIDALEQRSAGQPLEKSSSKPRIKFRGDWNPKRAYSQGDAVLHKDKLYAFAFKHMTYTPYPTTWCRTIAGYRLTRLEQSHDSVYRRRRSMPAS